MSLVQIDLYDGKYTVLHDEDHGGITILRHNEAWRNETGDGLILAMIQKIQEQKNKIESLNQELEEVTQDRNIWRSNSLDWNVEEEDED